jgi:hypothetical protein
MNRLLLRLGLLVAGVFSLYSPSHATPVTTNECVIARIAERYLVTHYPDFDSIRNPPVVRDMGALWEVHYKLPDGQIGGTPIIEVEKSSLKIVRVLRGQ